jgi:uncharacterized protein YbaP (TraB family)
MPSASPLRRRAAGALVATVLAVTTAFAQTANAEPNAPAGTASGKGFIWKIERDGRLGWLVGSLHILTPDYYPLPEAMENAFMRSATLMEEVDQRELATPELISLVQQKGFYQGNRSLESEVSKETFAIIRQRAERLGLDIARFQRMKPWMASLTLLALEAQKGGFDAAHGVDRHFFEKAPRMGKKFRALETAAEQIGFLADLDGPLQEAMFRESAEGFDSELAQVTAMANAWRDGDVATLERIVLGTMKDAPQVYDVIFAQRNRAWVPKIEDCLAEGHCFVVVGAGHLVGPDGLLKELKKRGYTVEQE